MQGHTILVVSNDPSLSSTARKELAAVLGEVRVTAVSGVEAARVAVEDAAPAVILLEESVLPVEGEGLQDGPPGLEATAAWLAGYAPVVVLGTEEHREGLSALIAAGAADYVRRQEGCFQAIRQFVEARLEQSRSIGGNQEPFALGVKPETGESWPDDFGELLRHELNNPLTGILGNAELLLAELRRKNDGHVPAGAQQRLETIAALAVRLRETIRRLSHEWEERRDPVRWA